MWIVTCHAALEHNAGWNQSTERHADRVRRHLLKGADSDAFGAYFKQFDPEGDPVAYKGW